MSDIKLTQYSHGAGCGCKIAPQVLDTMLQSELPKFTHPNLIVGNESRDDAAVFDLGDGSGIISTTDFFMPIVDDAFEFDFWSSSCDIWSVSSVRGNRFSVFGAARPMAGFAFARPSLMR